MLKSEFEKLKQEKESNQLKIENFDNASKSLDKLIGNQIPDKSRKGVGFVSYNVVSHPPTRLFSPPKLDLSNSRLEEFQQPKFEGYGSKTSNSVSEDISNEVKESPDAPLVMGLVSDDKLEKKTVFPTVAKIEFYEKIDGGYVAFEGDPKGGKITGKGKISTEAVNTACFVQNKVLVIKPHNKTPYELFHGRTPSLSFMRPSGCPVTILNTLNPLGKFDGKADEGFFIGYFINSKAFKVFSSRTRIVEETLHITFLENKPNVAGSGPTWLFDIDTLTKSMNYKPIVAGNQSNGSADKARVETVPDKDYILLPLWTQDPLLSSSSKDSPSDGFKPSGEEEKKDAKDPGNKDNEVLSTEEARVSQEKDLNVNNTNNINTVSLTINVADIEDNVVDENIFYDVLMIQICLI
nr:retrovirus-related Pol polyprotein from transposon TNT 1-94 [Tanacetum cinerariifolium]